MPTATIAEAIAAIAAGQMVVVVDDEDRENEGDLIVAAEHATPEVMAFFVRHTSGLICASVTSQRADELDLPLMVARNTESQRTAFTVTVDYRLGTTTGISATDRSLTARALVDPATRPEDLDPPRSPPRAASPRRRGAQAGRPHRGGGRPGPPGRAEARRRALRGGHRRRPRHGPPPRPREVRGAATTSCW